MIQSRGGKPLERYFPELEFPAGRYVIDGEIVIDDPAGGQDFDALQNRIHPALSRITMLSEQTPAHYVAFDLLAYGDESWLERPFSERRARLEELAGEWIDVTPLTQDPAEAEPWLRSGEGVVAKDVRAPYRPGERTGMMKIKRVRTADAVVQAFRFGKEEGTLGSLILGAYEDGELRVVGHTSGFTAKQKRELVGFLEPYRTFERGSGEASRWKSDEELVWEGLRPELVVEVNFDHITGNRIRHGAKFVRWREDKDPRECTLEQLRT